MKRKWKRELEVYWCPSLNVPVFRRSDCKGAVRLNLFLPRDLRPAWEGDVKHLKEIFGRELGRGAWTRLTEGRMAFLNKTSYIDHAYQIVVDGDILARILYDPLMERWYLRLGYLGAVRALQNNLIRSKVIDNPKPGEIVGTGDEQVALLDRSGKVIGIAIPKKGKLRVDKVWKHPRRGALSTRKQTLEDVYKANEKFIRELVKESVQVIHRGLLRADDFEKVVVSLSGGKDSALVVSLLDEALQRDPPVGVSSKEVVLLFNDTGLEMPETVKTVEEESEFFGYQLEVVSAGDAFWRAVRMFSPPARDFRWCCKVTKFGPIARYMMKTGSAINLVGNRWWESLERARAEPIMKMKYLPTVLSVNPILRWPQLLEFVYLIRNGVPLNPLYFEGFDRIGCFMCPGATQWEFKLLKELHPELWEKWENVLEYWRKRLGYGKWWSKGGWKWLAPEHPKQVMASRDKDEVDWRREYERRQTRVVFEGLEEGDGAYRVKIKYNKRRALGLAGILGHEVKGNIVKGPKGIYIFNEGEVIVKSKDKEEVFEAIRVIHATNACAGCKICETWCPTGAIEVVPEGNETKPVLVEPDKCERCRLCMYLCPSADVVADKLIGSLLYNDPKAWKRPTKPHKEKVQELAEKAWKYLIKNK
ncbi:hypothetical protein EYM_04610 [Ignicoccus islandicus DSM 13165]|uniref:4Fe-4S ferredoxin-type domain-containing protein n=1 Tax=Ignicoccus islandicus DSM 13165 TaxID=940295 RepID=A0A0U3FA10_9CREN|nr:phosphoadenosine phosphosulfate reductase family protein [Ignicoccus islandicus]ALU12505.1 hypothetical protein EYM_04610 [Ignicoccus islandicus DSM 13165]